MITNDDLLNWVNNMPLWFRKATELYYQKNEITDDDIKKLADLCLYDDKEYKVNRINLIKHGEKKGFVIKSIDSVMGVNAISSDKPLEFGDSGITVVYGLNGAGKSGYIRILKMISGAKYREDIMGNIYVNSTVEPKATITIGNDEGEFSYENDLHIPGQFKELRDIDIFDTKISNAYISDAKEATYEPWVFGMFAELADVADRIKEELKNREKEYVLKEYKNVETILESNQAELISSLTYESNIEDFPSVWSQDDEEELNDIKTKNQISSIKADIKRLENEQMSLKSIKNYFIPFKDYFDNNNLIKLKRDWDDAKNEKMAAELLFSKNASEIDAESVSLDSWKKLWSYARLYSESSSFMKTKSAFLIEGGECPLCLQKVDSEHAYNRIKSIDSYVNGKAAEREQKAKKVFEQSVRMSHQVKGEEDLVLLIQAGGLGEKKDEIIKINNELLNYSEYISENIENYDGRVVDVVSVLKIIEEKYNDNLELIQENTKLIEGEEQKKIIDNIRQLEGRKALVANYSNIKYNIACLKNLNTLSLAAKKVTKNKITTKSKELAQEMITGEYVSRFDNELKELTKNGIEVKLVQQRGGSGRIPYKVVLSDVNGNQLSPRDILSEGENRVTALAAFFAESSGRTERTPLIVDDPISSLDYLYEGKVIDRLVRASLHRQVIVFTHRISMVVGISEKAKEHGVNYKEISLKSNRMVKGVPSDISDIGGKAKAQLNNLIQRKFNKLKKLDCLSEDYSILFHNTCQDFRNIVEKSIEDVLLNEVVKRFRRDVQTKNRLSKLADITTEDCQMFDRFMTKYSYYDHSSSDETPLIEISLDELENDLIELQTWMEQK